jgi:DNA primase
LRLYPEAINYLKNRGISGQIAKQFGLGYAPQGWNHLLKTFPSNNETIKQLLAAGLITNKEGQYYDRFRQRIMFPIKDRQGRVIGFGGRVIDSSLPKYLNSPETSLFHKGRELYGLYEARQQTRELETIILVEGYMDVIALAQQGITNCVATLGTATTAEHLQQLFRCAPEIIFCFDGDRAGQTAAWRALEQALPFMEDGRQVRFMFLPEGEDPDSYVRKIGAASFKEALTKATPLTDYLLNHLLENIDINTLAGKAKLAAQAKPLIEKMPANVLQHLLLEQLAQRMRIDMTRLKSAMRQKPKAREISLQQKHKTSKALSPMQLALALLLQNPSLALAVDTGLLEELQLPGNDLLQALITLIKKLPADLTTGTLLEHWRNHPMYTVLSRLAAHEHLIPIQNQQQQLAATLQRLQQLNAEAKINALIAKARQETLTEAEKQQLQELIATSKI